MEKGAKELQFADIDLFGNLGQTLFKQGAVGLDFDECHVGLVGQPNQILNNVGIEKWFSMDIVAHTDAIGQSSNPFDGLPGI